MFNVQEFLQNLDHAIRPKDLARLVNVSPTTIYKAIYRGEIHAFSLGRTVRISPAEAARWAKEQ